VAGHIEVAPSSVFNDLRVKRVPEAPLIPLMFPAQCQKDRTPKAFPATYKPAARRPTAPNSPRPSGRSSAGKITQVCVLCMRRMRRKPITSSRSRGADRPPSSDVRFAPTSGGKASVPGGPTGAKFRNMHCSKWFHPALAPSNPDQLRLRERYRPESSREGVPFECP
jgi:hypothetical protein